MEKKDINVFVKVILGYQDDISILDFCLPKPQNFQLVIFFSSGT